MNGEQLKAAMAKLVKIAEPMHDFHVVTCTEADTILRCVQVVVGELHQAWLDAAARDLSFRGQKIQS